ncbi:MAG TPA: DCC1-like thiol-disulfide oxidoreductase family protein [Thermomicrobiales bacterium]|nr:DCC1-like thiol-disulfide oxidoreductase family protein [Thermomicrobiales bacterium]
MAQQEARYGLEGVDCGKSAWGLTEDGHRESGGQAATLIASALLQQRWTVTVGRLPGIRHALAFGYRIIAINRHHFPGDTPWCEANPGRCGTD